jgi:hypothetical protein
MVDIYELLRSLGMKKASLGIILLLIFFLFYIPVSSQSSITLPSVRVDILPEYDQPSILYITRVTLPDNLNLPALVSLKIPSQAEIYAVAVVDPVNGLLNAPYEREVQGNWANLEVTANFSEIQVEYYDTLPKDGLKRQFVYEWQGKYAVDNFLISFQQPASSTELTTNPELVQSLIGQDGLTYWLSNAISLSADESFQISISYTKTTDTLSTTGLPVQPSEPVDRNTPGMVTLNNIAPLILAGLGGGLLVLGILVGLNLWRKGSHGTQISHKRHGNKRQVIDPNVLYCHECGKRAQPGDEFCRTCGSRLRKEKTG